MVLISDCKLVTLEPLRMQQHEKCKDSTLVRSKSSHTQCVQFLADVPFAWFEFAITCAPLVC
jgi:hypothetical protein